MGIMEDALSVSCHIMSYYGWDGKENAFESSELLSALFALRHAGIGTDLIIHLNDSGMAFDNLERNGK
jgi:hypothetical protein